MSYTVTVFLVSLGGVGLLSLIFYVLVYLILKAIFGNHKRK